MDTANKFFVSIHPATGHLAFLRPIPAAITSEDALLLAAWLVAMADPLGETFAKVLEEVQRS